MIEIDVRKLISFGKGSFIISMPKGWVEKNHLKKGDLISVDDGGSELVISASAEEKKSDLKEITIDAKNKEISLLKAEIVSCYLNGYDTLNILFDSGNKDVPMIKEVIRNLSGMEIMEQTSTRLVAKNLINLNEISISNIIRRMDVIARAMMQDVISCSRDSSIYESIYNRDSDINRLYYLGFRVMKNAIQSPRAAKSLGIGTWQLHSDNLILNKIEKVADRQKRIARYLANSSLDRKAMADIERVYGDLAEAYNEVMKSYYSQDKGISYRIEVSIKDKTAVCNSFLERYTRNYAMSKNNGSASNLVAVAKIIENIKGTAVEIRDMARAVLCYE